MNRNVKGSDSLRKETLDLEEQLRFMKLQLAKRKAENPKAFGKGGIWKTYQDRKNSSQRKKSSRRGKRRKGISSAGGKRIRNVDFQRRLQKNNSEPDGLHSHHFATAFSPTKPEIPSCDVIPKKPKRKKVNFQKMRKRDDRFRKKQKEERIRKMKKTRTAYEKKFSDVGKVDDNLRTNLKDTYEFQSSSKFRKKNTLEEIMTKRKEEKMKEEGEGDSLVAEAFAEWRNIQVQSKEDPSIVRQSLDKHMFSKKKKESKSSTSSSSTTTTSRKIEDQKSTLSSSKIPEKARKVENPTNDILEGEYDEEASKRSFQEALEKWKSGNTEMSSSSSTKAATATATMTTTDSKDGEKKQWWEGEYDEQESRREFQEALMDWRQEKQPESQQQSEEGTTADSGNMSDLMSGTYDEAEQSRLFREAVEEWRKGDQSRSPHPSTTEEKEGGGGGLFNLLQGDFDLSDTKGETENNVDITIPKMKFAGDVVRGQGAIEVKTGDGRGKNRILQEQLENFSENVKSCMVVTFFDLIEEDLQRKIFGKV